MLNDPIEIVSAIKNSKFGRLNVTEIKTNKRKGLLVAEVRKPKTVVEELLNVKHIGKWEVQCYLPNCDKFTVGVISPVSMNSDLKQIQDLLSANYNIHAIERLKKKSPEQGWIPSTAVKISFNEPDLPTELTIGHSFYKVWPFVNLPVQCYRCQRLGHTAQGCRAKVRCLICGGEHNKEVCSSQQVKCANCSGTHTANSRYCNQMRVALEMEREKAHKKAGYMSVSQGNSTSLGLRQHSREYGNSQRSIPNSQEVNLEALHDPEYTSLQQVSYRDMLTNSGEQSNKGRPIRETNTVDAAMQTVEGNIRNEYKCLHCKDILVSMKKLFIEIMLQVSQSKNINKPESVVEAAFDSCFGKDSNNTKDSIDLTKRYPSRRQCKDKNDQGNVDLDNDSLEEGVVSTQDSSSDNESLFETVEKRKIRINRPRTLNASDFNKDKGNLKGLGSKSKKKRNLVNSVYL